VDIIRAANRRHQQSAEETVTEGYSHLVRESEHENTARRRRIE